MRYPDLEEYNILYARFLKRDPRELLSVVTNRAKLKGLALDLCGGGGRASFAALEMGASRVILVDSSSNMTSFLHIDITVIHLDVFVFLTRAARFYENALFDLVICQQAINYWFSESAIAFLSLLMRPGACFVFNTFNTKPPAEPTIKNYSLGGREYSEINWCDDETVYHVQRCKGFEPHLTSFQWIPPEQFLRTLVSYFEVKTIVKGATTIYACWKP